MKDQILPDEAITNKIYLIRGQKVMLDSDLAELYNTETRILKQQVKRNINRFPGHYMFELTKAENELNIIFDEPKNQIPAFMFRIFKASASPERTIRKSNNKIFSIGRA